MQVLFLMHTPTRCSFDQSNSAARQLTDSFGSCTRACQTFAATYAFAHSNGMRHPTMFVVKFGQVIYKRQGGQH